MDHSGCGIRGVRGDAFRNGHRSPAGCCRLVSRVQPARKGRLPHLDRSTACVFAHPTARAMPCAVSVSCETSTRPLVRTGFVAHTRSLLMLSTCICILAVGFSSSHKGFAKTATLGYSVMDLGTLGLFFPCVPRSRLFYSTSTHLTMGTMSFGALHCSFVFLGAG